VDFPAVKPIIAAGICCFNVFLTILIIFSITYIQGVRLLGKPTELFVILYKKSVPIRNAYYYVLLLFRNYRFISLLVLIFLYGFIHL
jgi:hypothetical protein